MPRRLNEVRGIEISTDTIARGLSVPFSVLKNDEGKTKFLAVFNWVLEQIRSS